MIVVYPFFPGDQELALKNARWFNELGGCKNHEVLMIPDKRCLLTPQIEAQLAGAFKKVYTQKAMAEIDGWPEGANYFFRTATAWLANRPQWPYFFWMEPDAIPLQKSCLDAIQAEYERLAQPSGKRFMGDRVQVENIPLHMSGVGIYPNPLHAYAGEAYRASEVAWDIAGKDQIVPNAFFTKLIEHAWKHPKFTSNDELHTQIRPETVLFHSSKDGSLIDLARENLTGAGQGPVAAGESGESPHSYSASANTPVRADTNGGTPSGRSLICDIFIRTYPKDYPWLKHCLASIDKFCTGFRKIWIVSPEDAPVGKDGSIIWKAMNDESEDGYLAQQITKLYADVITGYEPDYILHIDSDTLFTRPVTPVDFFHPTGFSTEGKLQRKLIWYYTPYEKTKTPWKPITEKFLGEHVANEFMRRLPMMMPKFLYAKMREFCFALHHRIISEYVRTQPYREFSEFNALGAFAFSRHHDEFHWVNTEEGTIPAPFARQFYSWGGITDEVKKEIEQILDGGERSTGEANISPAGRHDPPPENTLKLSPEAKQPGAQPTKSERATFSPAPPPVTFLSQAEMVKAVCQLEAYAQKDISHRKSVMRTLSHHGLTPRWPKKRKWK